MGSESRSFRVAVMAGNMGKEARPPNSPRGHGDLHPGRECDALARNACELVHTAGVA